MDAYIIGYQDKNHTFSTITQYLKLSTHLSFPEFLPDLKKRGVPAAQFASASRQDVQDWLVMQDGAEGGFERGVFELITEAKRFFRDDAPPFEQKAGHFAEQRL